MAQNGAMGAITDVPGIRVGHVQKNDDGWLTGVTVVLPPPGTVGSVDVRGGGPGTHETDALNPTTLVSTVDAVVLTGGSAYGLVSAHGAQRWCEENGRRLPGDRRSSADRPRRSHLRPGPRRRLFSAARRRTWGTRQPPPPRPEWKVTMSDAATWAPEPERSSGGDSSKAEWARLRSRWRTASLLERWR